MLTLLLVACADSVTLDDSGKSPVDDTADTADTADSGGDTSDTTETGDSTPAEPDFHFTIDGSVAGLGLDGVWVEDLSTFSFGDTAFDQAVPGASFDVTVGDPDGDHTLSLPDYPDTVFGFLGFGLYEDDDGDGAHGSGELYVNVDELAIWIGGEVPAELAAVGIGSGWNAIAFATLANGTGGADDPMDVLLEHHAVNETLTLSGTFGDDPDGVGVVLYPGAASEGGHISSLLYDEPLAGDVWTATSDGEPPADHFYDIDGAGTYAALEYPVSYTDAAPAGFGAGDTALYPACFHGRIATGYWVDGWDDQQLATQLAIYGLSAGWNVLAYDAASGESTLLTAAEASQLTMDDTCTFG